MYRIPISQGKVLEPIPVRSRSEPQRSRAEKAVQVCMEKRGGEGRISWKIRSYKEARTYTRSSHEKEDQ